METGELLAHVELVESGQFEGNEACSDDDYDHLQCLIDALFSESTPERRIRAEDFIKSYSHVFSKSATNLGQNRTLPHRISIGSNLPVKEPLWRHPYAHFAEIERLEIVNDEVIEPAQSARSSNVLFVRKKGDSMQFCVDTGKLNNITVKDS